MATLQGAPSPVDHRPRRLLAGRSRARRLADAVRVGARLLADRLSRNGSSAGGSISATTPSIAISRPAAEQTALIYLSTETGETKRYTYRELAAEVNRCAAIFKAQGVGRGDRVLIYMPMIAEAAFAMLACVRIGAIHSVVFGGFAAASLATRIDDATPKLMVTSDAGMRGGKPILYKHLVDEALRLAAQPAAQGRDRQPRSRSRDADRRGPRSRLRDAAFEHDGRDGALRMARILGAVVHPLYVRHDGQAQRRPARYGRLRRRARLVDAPHLLRRAGRDDVHDERHRLGRRSLLHHLCAAHRRRDDDPLRRTADPARSRDLVEDRRRARRAHDVQLADGDPRAEEAGSGAT